MKPSQWHKIDFKIWGAEKVNRAESTLRWFQTNQFSRVTEFNSHCEIEANVNLVVQLKKDLKFPIRLHSQKMMETYL